MHIHEENDGWAQNLKRASGNSEPKRCDFFLRVSCGFFIGSAKVALVG